MSDQVATNAGRTSRHPDIRNRLAMASVIVIGIFLMVAVIAVLTIVLISGSHRNVDESFSEYMLRVFSGSKKTCADDPPAFPMLHRDWDGKSRTLGTVIQYRCGTVPETAIARAFQCRSSGKWAETYNRLESCNLDEEGKRMFKQYEEALNIKGCTSRDPPPSGPYHRDWNQLKWTIGTTINYYCTEDDKSPLVMTVECTSDYSWTTKLRNNENCECSGPPPEYENKKPLTDWDSQTKWIGTVVAYKCSATYDSAVEKLYTCTIKKEWVATSLTTC